MNQFFYYGFDSLYLYLVVPAILIAVWSQFKVKSTFAKYSERSASLSGAEAAHRVLIANGVTDVRIERVSGNLTDHYDPKTNVIRLSDTVYDSRTISAVGVAAHEAGHAVQYAREYRPIHLRAVILPVCNLGSQLSMPLLVIGLIFQFAFLMKLGVIFFCLALLFQLLTLPIEFDASRRAISAIRADRILSDEADIRGAKKVLSAAAMTYVAALLVSLAQLIRLIAISNRKR
ncbi:MAG: zinc metallopeptidase [Clostridia bacterium]|nr:zinc metallopeptidase [Clostridia bacterium]